MLDPNKTFKLNKGDSVKCNKVNGYIIKEDGSVT